MSVEENKAIARRLVEEGTNHPDILGEMVADDVVAPGNIRSLDAYKQMMSEWVAGFPDGRFVAEEIIAEGDKVVVRWTSTGTHTGEWAGISPTNKQVKVGGTYILRFVGGKVVEVRWHWNAFWLYTQLGLIPPWEEFVKQAQSKLG